MTLTKSEIIASIVSDPEYLTKCCEGRSLGHPRQNGSYYKLSPQEIAEELTNSHSYEEYSHPSITEGCQAFRIDLPGYLGVVPLQDCNSYGEVSLIDPKNIGKASAELLIGSSYSFVTSVEFTVIILGPKELGEGLTLWTFHPGEPVRASEVLSEGNVGKTITIGEALDMGLTHAKVKLI